MRRWRRSSSGPPGRGGIAFALDWPGIAIRSAMAVIDHIRTSTFRWALMASGSFAAFVLMLFGFIYWKTDDYLIARSDRVVSLQLDVVSALPTERQIDAIYFQLAQDPRGVQFAALFGPDGSKIAGNLARRPDLTLDGRGHNAELTRDGANHRRS